MTLIFKHQLHELSLIKSFEQNFGSTIERNNYVMTHCSSKRHCYD